MNLTVNEERIMFEKIFSLSVSVRYVAIYKDGNLQTKVRDNLSGASEPESDRYEELLVNPTLLTLTTQRGDIDCGGLDYLLVRYGNFFQLVLPSKGGHTSVCIESDADVLTLAAQVREITNS